MWIIVFCACSNEQNDFSVSLQADVKKLGGSGSNRATAYIDSNKIIETADEIHFFWLDYFEGSFRVMGTTYDKVESIWSESIFISDEVWDNHGGPAVVIDNAGIIHLFFGPHSGPMKYIRSKNPHNIEAWTGSQEIGDHLTYPTVVIDNSNSIYLFARKYDGSHAIDELTSLVFYKNENGIWSQPTDLAIPNFNKWIDAGKKLNYSQLGYVRWTQSARIDSKNRIHLVYKNYEYLPEDLITDYQNFRGGASYFVGYLYSDDGGTTWNANEQPLVLPATPQTIEKIIGESDPPIEGYYYNISNLSLDANDQPVVVLSKQSNNSSTDILLAQRQGGKWELSSIFPESKGYKYATPIALSIDNNNNFFVATSRYPVANFCNCENDWGNRYIQTTISMSENGGVLFDDIYSSDVDENNPVWFANIQNVTYLNNYPSLLITVGNSVEENTNNVYAIRISEKVETP